MASREEESIELTDEEKRLLCIHAMQKPETIRELHNLLENKQKYFKTWQEIEKLKQKGIELQFQAVAKRDSELDKMIVRYRSMGEMQRELGLNSRQNVLDYMRRTNQHDGWKKGRKKLAKELRIVKEKQKIEKKAVRKNEIKEKINSLNKIIQTNEARERDTRDYAALEKYYHSFLYCKSAKPKKYDNKLLDIFRKYFRASDKGIKISLENLGKRGQFSISEVQRILGRARLKPMFGRRKQRYYNPDLIERLKEAVQVGLDYSDLAYFASVPRHIVRSVCKDIEAERLPRLRGSWVKKRLNYQIASRVYDALDRGKVLEEIAKEEKIPDRTIYWLEENRGKIAPKIKRVLSTLYPEEEIDRPYRRQ